MHRKALARASAAIMTAAMAIGGSQAAAFAADTSSGASGALAQTIESTNPT